MSSYALHLSSNYHLACPLTKERHNINYTLSGNRGGHGGKMDKEGMRGRKRNKYKEKIQKRPEGSLAVPISFHLCPAVQQCLVQGALTPC